MKDFKPNVENRKWALAMGLDVDEECKKFIQWHLVHPNKYQSLTWQDLFGKWLNKAYLIKIESQNKGLEMNRKHPMDGVGFSNGKEILDPRKYDEKGNVIVSDSVKRCFDDIDRMLGRKNKRKTGEILNEK